MNMNKEDLIVKVSNVLNDTGAYRKLQKMLNDNGFRVGLDDIYDTIHELEELITNSILEKEEELNEN